MVLRKTPAQIAVMRRAGSVVAEMHEACRLAAKPGATTGDLDAAARDVLERRHARSNFLGYHGFPAVACISPNEVIVHGIPGARVLDEGDIVSIDCGAIVEGWHADAAITIGVGAIDAASQKLLDRSRRRRWSRAIAAMKAGAHLGDLGAAVEATARAGGFSVVREYVGHGIGTAMHEEPEVPNYGPAGRGLKLREGIVLAIEPMLAAGSAATQTLADGWTVVTARRLARCAFRALGRAHRQWSRDPDASLASRSRRLRRRAARAPARCSAGYPPRERSPLGRVRRRRAQVVAGRAGQVVFSVGPWARSARLGVRFPALKVMLSGQAQRRHDPGGRHGGRAVAERHVPGRAGERAQSAGSHFREDAHALHPHRPGRSRTGRAHALRPLTRPHHVSVQVTPRSLGRADEGSTFGEEDVRQVQGDPPSRFGADHLRRPASQAAAGLGRIVSNGSYRRRRHSP